jgi:hypothetical protein
MELSVDNPARMGGDYKTASTSPRFFASCASRYQLDGAFCKTSSNVTLEPSTRFWKPSFWIAIEHSISFKVAFRRTPRFVWLVPQLIAKFDTQRRSPLNLKKSCTGRTTLRQICTPRSGGGGGAGWPSLGCLVSSSARHAFILAKGCFAYSGVEMASRAVA